MCHGSLIYTTGGYPFVAEDIASEGLPVSMMEAQIVGLPIVSTDVGGVSEIVTPGTGLLLPASYQQEQFDSAVLALRQRKNKAIRGRIARHACARFSLGNYGHFVEEVLLPQMEISAKLLRA
ncbi:MAG: glycosyltransferase [Desulfovibrio sp.]|nr:glycosyltransferase [Desulfovibrio sp.]